MDHQFYNSPTTCIQQHITSLTTLHPTLKQLGSLSCVVQASLDPTKVSLICGGGSGHEPAHAGYVGQGMLSGAVAGGVFASPSTSIILELITEVTGDAGCLVIVKNYTGDCLNFGIAAEKAKKGGLKVELVICADDTTLLDKDTLAGPRGLCGVLFIQKIAGAFAAQGHSLEAVYRIAQLVCKNIGTAGVAISPCVPPGKEPSFTLPPHTMEFGIGIHGEPGVVRCASVDCTTTVAKLFSYLCDTRGLGLSAGDDIAVIVNNLGGTSELEMGVVTHEVVKWLEVHQVTCHRLYCGVFITSFGMHGISISVLKLDKEGNMLELLKYPTSAPSWRAGCELTNATDTARPLASRISKVDYSGGPENSRITRILTTICEDLQGKVGKLDELDRVSGDGDCGSTIAGLITKLKEKIRTLNSSSLSLLLTQLACIVEEHMGGSSGALYTIGLTGAAARAEECETGACDECGDAQKDAHKEDGPLATTHTVTACLSSAITAISRYGKAQEGDCTMLDVLYPVLRVLQLNTSVDIASLTAICVQAADTGVLKTATMVPRAGRASYIGTQKVDESADPGAVAAATWIKAVCKTLYQLELAHECEPVHEHSS